MKNLNALQKYIKTVSDKSLPSLHQSFCFGTFSTQVHSYSLISFKEKKRQHDQNYADYFG